MADPDLPAHNSPAVPDLDDGVPTTGDLVEPEDADVTHTGGVGDLDFDAHEEG